MVVEPFEVLLPIRVVKNPIPFLAPGGDCGPCAICAAVGWGPERIPDIYRMAGLDPYQPLTTVEVTHVLHALQWHYVLIEYADEPLLPRPDDHYPWIWGYPAWTLSGPWFDMLRLRLEAGWVGLTVIDFAGAGPVEERGGRLMPRIGEAHWVLLTGARAGWQESGDERRRWVSEVRVTDSSTRRPDEWWCEVEEFLLRYGGFRVIWVRRRR